ncbi:outer membrane protein [Silvanigrella aquatica]|uniref:Uncharacterized protein n=1 Tax=Silvanigrella aquatica TaxID=1915309 RepID=A0A1L4CZY9_9BACT|nr:outer membrane beta-barrel protein [Silvanigrella aquatica]APJ03523.1 hypothetical protein AXG55_06220 [Silvanigrella aquatica]
MKINKYLSLLSVALLSNSAFAEESLTNKNEYKNNIDVLGGIGYTNYSDFQIDGNKLPSNYNMNGLNMNAAALYSIYPSSFGSPVLGLGLNYTYADVTFKSDGGSQIKFGISSLSSTAHAGYKFLPIDDVSIYALANFGYGIYTRQTSDISSGSYTSSSDNTGHAHFIYGGTVAASYSLDKNWAVGLGATWQQHYMTILNSSEKFNEISANLIASYSL